MNAQSETPRSRLRIWVSGARPRTLYASVSPVVVGTAAASNPEWARAIGCLMVAMSLQVGVNYANDYFDGIRKVDTAERVGPTRLTASGLASPAAVRVAAGGAFAAAAAVGLWLALTTNPWLLVFGAVAILAAVLYSGGPRPYAARGLGEASVFLFFGLFATAGTAYVQDGSIPTAAWWGAVAIGLLAVAILVANNLRDIATDAAAGKRTLAVRLGNARTRETYRAIVMASFATVGLGVVAGSLPWQALLAFAALPYAIRLMRTVGHAGGRDLVPVLAGTAVVEFGFACLLAAGLLLGRIT